MGLFVVLAGFFLALASVGVFSATGQNIAQAKQKYNPAGSSIDLSVLPPGFDCSQIYEKGIDRQENFRAGLIMMACGEAEGGWSTQAANPNDEHAAAPQALRRGGPDLRQALQRVVVVDQWAVPFCV